MRTIERMDEMHPHPWEIAMLRTRAIASKDMELLTSSRVAMTQLGDESSATQRAAVDRAIVRCVAAIEVWRATRVAELTNHQILDLQSWAARAHDHHAFQVCARALADRLPSKYWQVCLVAWNARADRLAKAAA